MGNSQKKQGSPIDQYITKKGYPTIAQKAQLLQEKSNIEARLRELESKALEEALAILELVKRQNMLQCNTPQPIFNGGARIVKDCIPSRTRSCASRGDKRFVDCSPPRTGEDGPWQCTSVDTLFHPTEDRPMTEEEQVSLSRARVKGILADGTPFIQECARESNGQWSCAIDYVDDVYACDENGELIEDTMRLYYPLTYAQKEFDSAESLEAIPSRDTTEYWQHRDAVAELNTSRGGNYRDISPVVYQRFMKEGRYPWWRDL